MALTDEIVRLPRGKSQTVFRGGDGPPVVFLHGGGGLDPEDPLLAALAASHSVYAPIAPGFADLTELDEIRDVHELALHYDDLLEALGLNGVPVIGHSFGGMTAAELAAHVPYRVSKLVLIAPVGLWNDEYEVTDLFAVQPQDLPAVLFADTSHPAAVAMAPAPGAGEPDVEALVKIVSGLTTVAKFIFPIPDRGLARRLHRITAPTLVLWGSADGLVPLRYADDFVAAIPNARKVVVEGAGHMVPLEALDETTQAIEGFLAG
jgi:pimeloyl-ACP methyl ester carboxylesterase